jgi:hypothetical protein
MGKQGGGSNSLGHGLESERYRFGGCSRGAAASPKHSLVNAFKLVKDGWIPSTPVVEDIKAIFVLRCTVATSLRQLKIPYSRGKEFDKDDPQHGLHSFPVKACS